MILKHTNVLISLRIFLFNYGNENKVEEFIRVGMVQVRTVQEKYMKASFELPKYFNQG